MKSIKIILKLVIIASLTGCGNSATNEQIFRSEQDTKNEFDKPEKDTATTDKALAYSKKVESDKLVKKVALTNFTHKDVARFAISSITGQPSKTIRTRVDNGLYFTSYVRKSDSKTFDYKVKFIDEVIIWANADGRWRDS